MTIPSPDTAAPMSTDEEILERVRFLVDAGFRRQLWLFLLDAEDLQLPLLPRVEIPKRPDAFAVRHLGARLCEMARLAGAVSLAIVYERPGPERLSFDDRRWLRLLAEADGKNGMAVRGPLLAHARGVRWIAGEDLDDPSPPSAVGGRSSSP